DALRGALQEKFRAHEVDVDPSAWSGISAQLGHGAAAGGALGTAWIAAGLAAVAITAAALLWPGQPEKTPAPQPVQEQLVQALPPPPPAPDTTEAAPVQESAPKQQKAIPQPRPETAPAPRREQPVRTVRPAQPEQAESGASMAEAAGKAARTAPGPPPAERAVQAVPEPGVKVNIPESSTKEEAPAEHRGHAQQASQQNARPADPESETPSSPDPFRADEETGIFIPNVFSPQGDGVNDLLKIVAKDYEKADVRIFAAKGDAVVFRSNDLGQMWDGRLPNGNIAEEGYYRCIVILTNADGSTRVKTEVVRLYR